MNLSKADVAPSIRPPMDAHQRLQLQLYNQVRQASIDFDLLAAGDKIMVAMSGGKDSYTLFHILTQLVPRLPFKVELVAVHLDQVQPGYDGSTFVRYMEATGWPYEILREDTYSVVTTHLTSAQTYCSMCSRLRRGILYTAAERLGCNKIALGHHRDDLIHTYLLNLFFAGASATMPPLLHSDDGRNTVIRPLAFASEAEIARFSELKGFPIIPCDLCGSQENLQRQRVKRLVQELSKEIPNLKSSIVSAMGNLHVSHLLDKQFWTAPTEEAPQRAKLKQAEALVPLKFGDAGASGGNRHGA